MKMTRLAVVVAATSLAVLCFTFLPFLPGRHDSLAVALSAMAQTAGIASLVLVPVGILWILVDRIPRLAGGRSAVSLVALGLVALVWALASLVGAMQSGFTLGFASLIAGVFAIRRIWPRLKRTKRPVPLAIPLSLVLAPTVVVLIQIMLRGPAVEFSRNRAIRNSQPLITALDRYHVTHGHYPASLLAVWPDYAPGVIGIKEYRYEPHGDAYNLVFEQFTYEIGTREFVVYNPLGEHVMTSHAMDLLRLTPELLALERARGHYAVHDAPYPHWRYFWFD
jgi:hypothetical protein